VIKELLQVTDHYEKTVPFNEEAIERISKWFSEYGLRCCCVPYTKNFFETTTQCEKILDEVDNASFSFLLPDHLGQTTKSFITGTYNQLEDAGVLDAYDEIELVLPIHLIKQWNIPELEDVICAAFYLSKPVKLIIQTPMLWGFEIKMATELCVKNEISFVKTGTGYFGITLPKHVAWMRDALDMGKKAYGNETFLKVAGGIMKFTLADLALAEGGDILGMSRTAEIIEEIQKIVV